MLGRSVMIVPTVSERSAAPSLCAQVAKVSKPATAVVNSAGKWRRSRPLWTLLDDTAVGFGKASPCNEVTSSLTYRVVLR